MSTHLLNNRFNNISLNKEQQALEYLKCQRSVFYFIYNYVYIGEIGGLLKYDEEIMNPKIKQVVRSTIKHGKCICMASRQLGKALSLETPILKSNGDWTDIKSIKVGDEIFGDDGLPTKVINVTNIMNNHNCYEIEFDYSDKIQCDACHLWEIDWTPMGLKNKITTTEELFKYCKTEIEHPSVAVCKELKYSKKNLPIDPYILGIWLGDNSKEKDGISCYKMDYRYYSNYLKNKNIKYSDFNYEYKTSLFGDFTINDLINVLNKNNLLNNKHIPKKYLISNKYQRIQLLRGLMDSYGYCSMDGCCQFYQKNKSLILQVKELLTGLGIKSEIVEINSDKSNKSYYILKFYTRKFYVFNLKRKKEIQKKYSCNFKNTKHYIKSIKKIKSIPVKCISVDNKSKLFLCGNLIPTHNSTIAAALLLWSANFYPNQKANILNMNKFSGKENLNKIKVMHENLPSYLKTELKYKGERKTSINFKNGSDINVFYPSPNTSPSSLARSLTAAILYIDESAHIPHMKIAYASAQPTISRAREQAIKNGYPTWILVTSTPNGTIGHGQWFYEYWTKGVDSDLIFDKNDQFRSDSNIYLSDPTKNGFIKIKYHWKDDPTKDLKWYQQQCSDSNFDERVINQEYDLAFVGSSTCIFPDSFLAKLKDQSAVDFIELRSDVKIKLYKKFIDENYNDSNKEDYFDPNDYYLIGVDSAKSLVGDYNAIQIFKYSNFEQVGEYFGRLGSMSEYANIIKELVDYFIKKLNNENIILCIEANSIGNTVVESLELETNYDYSKLIYSPDVKKSVGIYIHKHNKGMLVTSFYDLVKENPLLLKSSNLIVQLSIIERRANGSVAAQHGQHDDLYMAAGLCGYVRVLSALEYEPLIGLSKAKKIQIHNDRMNSIGYINYDDDKYKNQIVNLSVIKNGVEYIEYGSEKELNIHDYINVDNRDGKDNKNDKDNFLNNIIIF